MKGKPEPEAPTLVSEYMRQLLAARRRRRQQDRPRWRAVLDRKPRPDQQPAVHFDDEGEESS